MKAFIPLLVVIIISAILRISNLRVLPNGLYWDEMDVGYQAYSLFKTGRDYFNSPAIFSVHSFADYRGPVYIFSVLPFISSLGLSPLAVRLPSLLWSLLGIISIYCLSNLIFRKSNFGLLSAILLSISPWYFHLSRISFESTCVITLFLVALACFFHSFTRPRWIILSAAFFGLTTATYSPAKLFTPLFILFLILFYRQKLFRNFKYAILALFIFSTIFSPIFIDGFFGPSSLRSRQLSVFSDPTTSDTVRYRREELQLSSGVPRQVGLSPRLIDKAVYNKLTIWGSAIIRNYFSFFSTEFLFFKGDPNPRHSPGRDSIGMFYLTDFLPILLGLLYVLNNRNKNLKLLLIWLLLAPLPAALTGEANPHSLRAILLLPILVILISLGVSQILKKSKILFSIYTSIFLLSSSLFLIYYYNNYRWESALYFQYGYDQVISAAISRSPDYNEVILDFYNDSPLMAYLFLTSFDPATFQSLHPLPQPAKFGNITLFPPGHRPWTDKPATGTLLYLSAQHPVSRKLPGTPQIIPFPDSTPAFFSYSF